MTQIANQYNPDVLLGAVEKDLIVADEFKSLFHRDVIEPLRKVTQSAKDAGFYLQVASSYRSFDRQLLIWNNKALGIRPVLDAHGQPIDIKSLTDIEKMYAILQWSALPGASRHHWGTDFDIYDVSRMAADYQVQLTYAETEGDGPFAPFHQWLSTELQENSHGFFRPYVTGVGSIAPEPWHLSYAPVANVYAQQLTQDILREKIQATSIELQDVILENLDDIYQRYINPYR